MTTSSVSASESNSKSVKYIPYEQIESMIMKAEPNEVYRFSTLPHKNKIYFSTMSCDAYYTNGFFIGDKHFIFDYDGQGWHEVGKVKHYQLKVD